MKTLTFKFCDINLKVIVMGADGANEYFDQYLSWYQIGTKSNISFSSNEILKTLT